MPDENNFLDITLLGKEYRVSCPPGEHAGLLAAVAYVDGKMHEIAEKTKTNFAERIAVMAALNIAHEYLSAKSGVPSAQQETNPQTEVDIPTVQRRISGMEAQLAALLQAQDKLL